MLGVSCGGCWRWRACAPIVHTLGTHVTHHTCDFTSHGMWRVPCPCALSLSRCTAHSCRYQDSAPRAQAAMSLCRRLATPQPRTVLIPVPSPTSQPLRSTLHCALFGPFWPADLGLGSPLAHPTAHLFLLHARMHTRRGPHPLIAHSRPLSTSHTRSHHQNRCVAKTRQRRNGRVRVLGNVWGWPRQRICVSVPTRLVRAGRQRQWAMLQGPLRASPLGGGRGELCRAQRHTCVT